MIGCVIRILKVGIRIARIHIASSIAHSVKNGKREFLKTRLGHVVLKPAPHSVCFTPIRRERGRTYNVVDVVSNIVYIVIIPARRL